MGTCLRRMNVSYLPVVELVGVAQVGVEQVGVELGFVELVVVFGEEAVETLRPRNNPYSTLQDQSPGARFQTGVGNVCSS